LTYNDSQLRDDPGEFFGGGNGQSPARTVARTVVCPHEFLKICITTYWDFKAV